MRWSSGDRSNIEDMRGRRGGGVVPLGIGGFIVVALLSWATGTDLFSLLGTSGQSPSQGRQRRLPRAASAACAAGAAHGGARRAPE